MPRLVVGNHTWRPISEEITVPVTGTSGVFFTYFPSDPRDADGNVVDPPNALIQWLVDGKLLGVSARVATGGGITLGTTTLMVVPDLTVWPDDTLTAGAGATKLATSAVPKGRRAYTSAAITPAASATEPAWADTLDAPKPFQRGFWVVVETSGGSGSGTTNVVFNLDLEVLGD